MPPITVIQNRVPTAPFQDATGRWLNYDVTAASGIPYIEFLKYEEHWQPENLSFTRYLACAWKDRYQFVADLTGTSQFNVGASCGGVQTNIQRYPPEVHPENNFAFVSDVQFVEGLGVPAGIPATIATMLSSGANYGSYLYGSQTVEAAFPDGSFPQAVEIGDAVSLTQTADPRTYMVAFALASYAVTYTARDYMIFTNDDLADLPPPPVPQVVPPCPGETWANPEVNRYCSKYLDQSVENLIIPGTSFQYLSDLLNGTPSVVYEPISIPVPKVVHQYVWRQVPGYPAGAISYALGKCNSLPFDNATFPPQTLKLVGVSRKQYFDCYGQVLYDITYLFEEKPWTHSAIYRKLLPEGGGVQVAIPGQGFYVYPQAPNSPGWDYIVANNEAVGGPALTPVTPEVDFAILFRLDPTSFRCWLPFNFGQTAVLKGGGFGFPAL